VGLGTPVLGKASIGALVIAANDDESLVFFCIQTAHSVPVWIVVANLTTVASSVNRGVSHT
jgi:hypothetical protein